MSDYASMLEQMMQAILCDDVTSAPALYRNKEGFPPEAQLAVYTRGYRIRLRKLLKSLYPALLYTLGKPVFTVLADGFIESTPPREVNIERYGIGFAEYVATYGPDRFATELARLESAIEEVYLLPDSAPLAADWLAQQAPESLTDKVLPLRTASRLFAFHAPVSNYLDEFRNGLAPARPEPNVQWLMVVRNRHRVQRLPLEEAEYTLLILIGEGCSLGGALGDARFAPFVDPKRVADDFRRWFARWLQEGMLGMPV